MLGIGHFLHFIDHIFFASGHEAFFIFGLFFLLFLLFSVDLVGFLLSDFLNLRLIFVLFLGFGDLFGLGFFLFWFGLIKLSLGLLQTLKGIFEIFKVFELLDVLVDVVHGEFRR